MLVDDHEVVRDGVRSLINANDDLIVVAEAASVQEAIDHAVRTKPDVVVMDVRLADGSGIEATREIRARLEKTQVLMLTSFADDEALFASIMAGAAGYVLKQIRGGELIRAIRDVGAGRSMLDPEVTRSVLERLRKGKTMRDEKLARLSGQEERILVLIAKGQTNGQIGKELKLAEKTVKNYVSTILSKSPPEIAVPAQLSCRDSLPDLDFDRFGPAPGGHKLEHERAENAEGRHEEPDSCVGRINAESPPAPRVEQGAAQHLALEQRRLLAVQGRELRLERGVAGGGFRSRRDLRAQRDGGAADPRVRLAAGHTLQVLADEVGRVNPGLVAVVDLLAGVVPDLRWELGRIESATGFDLVGAGEEDLLRHELVVHHPSHEAAFVEEEARGCRENHDEHRL